LQKYGVNGDKVGWIVLNDFFNSVLNAILFSVIPAKAGTQSRVDLVDCVSPRFSFCFPVRASLGPRFRGDDELVEASGGLSRKSGKRLTASILN
jgi:hypothetical protein